MPIYGGLLTILQKIPIFKKHILRWKNFDARQHITFFNWSTLRRLFHDSGFKLTDYTVTGLKILPKTKKTYYFRWIAHTFPFWADSVVCKLKKKKVAVLSNYDKLTVSIIVCTKDRYENLKNCLKSVISSYPSYPYDELIVVDSSEDPIVRRKIKTLCEKLGAKYFYEKRKGLSIARNTGIKMSSGEIIVFLDDDFIVDRDCIKNLVKNYRDHDVVCCTGRMLSYRNDYVSMLFEKYMSYDRGKKRLEVTAKDMNFINLFYIALSKLLGEKRSAPPYNVGFGFCSFRKKIFDVVGFFDINLGRGTPQMGSDDVDMYYRILEKGYKIVYEPTAIIYHNHRHTISGLIDYAYSSGVSITSFTKKHLKKDPYVLALFIGNLLLTVHWMLKSFIRSDRKSLMLSVAQLKGLFKI